MEVIVEDGNTFFRVSLGICVCVVDLVLVCFYLLLFRMECIGLEGMDGSRRGGRVWALG